MSSNHAEITDPTHGEILALLLKKDVSGLEFLWKLENTDAEASANLAWVAIFKGEFDSHVWYSKQLFEIIQRHLGIEACEKRIETNWSRLSGPSRRSICYNAGDVNLMRTEFIMKLFKSSYANVQDRHLLCAGLAISAEARGIRNIMTKLVDEIGNYSDPQRQVKLDSFRLNVKSNFS